MARRLARQGAPTMTIPSPPERKTPPTPLLPQQVPPDMLERLEHIRQKQINELAEQEIWHKEMMERVRGMVGRNGLGPNRTDNEDVAEGAEAGPASTEMAETVEVVETGGGGAGLQGWKRKAEDKQNDTTMEDDAASEASTEREVDPDNANEDAEPQKKRMKMTVEEAGGDGAGKEGSHRFKVTGDVDTWMHGAAE
ncbi:hypothetical protein EPUS_02934 [Endocarpon pusillum Z07020]|uniref:Uncharacterized protein n=1 Tax=Endocarpon pusillum (strain Z07020 / HMAS-L-300199) TaxID=1263415 RepID=U1GJ39_ENDPU|nr:uncharacterized protein EPUS_02934 [Endocarpon pusillum Z07020]ERF72143.1 hypothetical protein EPUS_02934 [Endocarpon pusillum Z07020]